jgi:2-oxoglutarate dehydrogenase E2 component (dihydrolipoamide succinyltransferase)
MINIVMPQMGESLAEGTVVRWLKAKGDRVKRDEPLFEISTDKVDTDVPSPADGVLKEILIQAGQTVAVGATVGTILTEREGDEGVAGQAQVSEEPAGHFKSAHPAQLVRFRRAGADSGARQSQDARSFSPAVLEAARQAGVSLPALTSLQGSGRGGRVTKRDVQRFLASARPRESSPLPSPAAGQVPPEYVYRPTPEDRIVPMSPVRRKIAHHMTWSTRISPHASAFGECDMSNAAALLERSRQRFEAEAGAPLTYTVLVAEVVVGALRDFPVLNSSVVDDSLAIKPHVNLGIAVALTDRDELIVPVIRRADELSRPGLARAIFDVAARARDRRLTAEDVQGGTFTLTNPGIFGGISGTPILNQPQVAILGLGAITRRPVVISARGPASIENDGIAVRPMMTLSLTFDHRATDGMQAFRFLEAIRQRLESITK